MYKWLDIMYTAILVLLAGLTLFLIINGIVAII